MLEVFEEEDYLQICEEVKNVKDLKGGISLVKKYEDYLEGANKKINNFDSRRAMIFLTELV